ncbi:hypothetical protein [Streptomyces sp. NBC_00842]|uniref:hypothetical protein n=1 Tax=Streptomyces sp. NBC_00842 TaxID=2975848 RepID=UPI0038698B5C
MLSLTSHPLLENTELSAEVLYARRNRSSPYSAIARFRALPVTRVLHAFEQVLGAHLAVEDAGQVAVDFYDGALLYDFARDTVRLIDLDEYRPDPLCRPTTGCRGRGGSWRPRSPCGGGTCRHADDGVHPGPCGSATSGLRGRGAGVAGQSSTAGGARTGPP